MNVNRSPFDSLIATSRRIPAGSETSSYHSSLNDTVFTSRPLLTMPPPRSDCNGMCILPQIGVADIGCVLSFKTVQARSGDTLSGVCTGGIDGVDSNLSWQVASHRPATTRRFAGAAGATRGLDISVCIWPGVNATL